MSYQLKICGLKDPDNIKEVVRLRPDYMGFIFYDRSPRFIDALDPEVLKQIPKAIKRTGVFVNKDYDQIMQMIDKYSLDAVQLHGDESLELVQRLKQSDLTVIKVFRIGTELPEQIHQFEGEVDLFLFDTQVKQYGGSGKHFDWKLLQDYPFSTPYLLSGGIALEDIDELKKKNLPGMIGIDVNSKFEVEPGLKNIKLLEDLKQQL
jgi:phosphoribosylanthranilate isomerase